MTKEKKTNTKFTFEDFKKIVEEFNKRTEAIGKISLSEEAKEGIKKLHKNLLGITSINNDEFSKITEIQGFRQAASAKKLEQQLNPINELFKNNNKGNNNKGSDFIKEVQKLAEQARQEKAKLESFKKTALKKFDEYLKTFDQGGILRNGRLIGDIKELLKSPKNMKDFIELKHLEPMTFVMKDGSKEKFFIEGIIDLAIAEVNKESVRREDLDVVKATITPDKKLSFKDKITGGAQSVKNIVVNGVKSAVARITGKKSPKVR